MGRGTSNKPPQGVCPSCIPRSLRGKRSIGARSVIVGQPPQDQTACMARRQQHYRRKMTTKKAVWFATQRAGACTLMCSKLKVRQFEQRRVVAMYYRHFSIFTCGVASWLFWACHIDHERYGVLRSPMSIRAIRSTVREIFNSLFIDHSPLLLQSTLTQ